MGNFYFLRSITGVYLYDSYFTFLPLLFQGFLNVATVFFFLYVRFLKNILIVGIKVALGLECEELLNMDRY